MAAKKPRVKKALKERDFKVIVEKHSDGYIAYPIGMNGVVVGQGDSYSEALADVTSAIRFHVATFGIGVLKGNGEVDAFVAETRVAV